MHCFLYHRDLMIHAQYGQDRGYREELGRAMNVLPGRRDLHLAPQICVSKPCFFQLQL